jgi:hypothetical protein
VSDLVIIFRGVGYSSVKPLYMYMVDFGLDLWHFVEFLVTFVAVLTEYVYKEG